MKPTIYAIAILAAVFGLMWLTTINHNNAPRSAARVQISVETYDAIRPGMGMADVVSIAGKPTHEIESHAQVGRMRMLYWQGNGQVATLTFVDDVLIDKMNAGITPETESVTAAAPAP